MPYLIFIILIFVVYFLMKRLAPPSNINIITKPMTNQLIKESYKLFHQIVQYQYPNLYKDKPELSKDLVEVYVSCMFYLYDQPRVLNTREKYQLFKRNTYSKIISWANYHYYKGNAKIDDIVYDNLVAWQVTKSLHPNSKKYINTVYQTSPYNQILSTEEYIDNDKDLYNCQKRLHELMMYELLRLHPQTKDNIDSALKNDSLLATTINDIIEANVNRCKLFKDKNDAIMTKQEYDRLRHNSWSRLVDIFRKYYYNNKPIMTDKFYDRIKNNLYPKQLHPQTIKKLGL